jgi:predicted nucleic acid-binding Zn ribbon protein
MRYAIFTLIVFMGAYWCVDTIEQSKLCTDNCNDVIAAMEQRTRGLNQ